MDMNVDVKKLCEEADELKAAWSDFEKNLAQAVLLAGGDVVAVIDLPGRIADTFRVGYKTYPRYYTRALIHLKSSAVGRAGSELDLAKIKFGISGKTGTFFPQPNEQEAEEQIRQLSSLRALVAWIGSGQRFIETVFAASKNATDE